MVDQILLRRDGAADWTANNPILGQGEIGIELSVDSQANAFKIGDGVTRWNDLAYSNSNSIDNIVGLQAVLDSKELLANKATTLDAPSNTTYPTTQAVTAGLGAKEDLTNKVVSIDAPNNTTYPTTQAVATGLGLKEDLTNKATNLDTPNNTTYPTTQAVVNTLDSVSVPTGGLTGYVLTKQSNDNYDADWNEPNYLPAAGTTGQSLVKLSSADQDVGWANPVTTIGQVTGLSADLAGKELLTNKATNLASPDNTKYPTTQAVVAGLDLKENLSSKATNLASPDNTKYPTTQAVATGLGLKEDVANKVTSLVTPNNTTYPTTQAIATEVALKGMPAGGTSGQALIKTSGTNYAVSWSNPANVANPYYVNGVAHFVQTTKPTERSPSVPLVVGDHWYKNSDGTRWSWNGTYWLGITRVDKVGAGGGLSSSDNYRSEGMLSIDPNCSNYLLTKVDFYGFFSSSQNPTGAGGEINSSINFWELSAVQVINLNSISAAVSLYSSQNITNVALATFVASITPNILFPFETTGRFGLRHIRTGSPSNIGGWGMSYMYRPIHN